MITPGAELVSEHHEGAVLVAVRELLASRHVGVAFRPVWNLNTRRIFGVEGLARPAGEHGLVGPRDAFVGAARLGRVDELDALCRGAVLAAAADLQSDVLLFLNVAPDVVAGGRSLGQRLLREVALAGLAPDRVVIELPDSAFERMGRVEALARELRDLGFRLALDRVGATAGGLGVLFAVGPAYIKVDPDVVRSASGGEHGRAVLAAIGAYAAEYDQVVIVQGVETPAMLHAIVGDRARLLGAQGYLLDVRPSCRRGAARHPRGGPFEAP